MDKCPLISIIIPTYNSSKYLYECLESVKSQTYPNLEVIIVDGKSSDNTRDIISNYLDNKSWHLFITKKGVSKQRNFGIDHSTGDYIFFFDSDDYFNKDFLSFLYESLVKQHLDIITPSITCALYRDRTLLETNKLPYKIRQNISKENFFIDLYDSFLAGPYKLYRRSVLSNTYFDNRLACGEDHIFNYEIACKMPFRFGICEESVYFYRVIEGEHPIGKRLNKSSTLFCKRFLRILKKLNPRTKNYKDAYILLKDKTNQFLECYVKARKKIPSNMFTSRLYFFLTDHSKKRWFYLLPKIYLKKIKK